MHALADPGTQSGIFTGFWFALLWYGAPIFQSHRKPANDFASRLRDTLVLGVAIPGILGCVNVLFGWSCVIVAIGIVVARIVRNPAFARRSRLHAPLAQRPSNLWNALVLMPVLACAWPLAVRPLLDGDSLSYHFPNAAAWADAHGIWITTTRYWWYPGGSELFAAGTFAVAGPFGLPLCGTLALALLGLRAYALALRASLAPIAAASLAMLVVTALPFVLQVGNLENDVWLSAFLLEMLWCARYEPDAFVRTATVTSLLKPIGWLFAISLAIVERARRKSIALSSLGFMAWLARDTMLWRTAVVPASASSYPHVESTTIAAHGWLGMTTLVAALARDPAFAMLAVGLVVTLACGRDRGIRMIAATLGIIFVLEPFGFDNGHAQLADGQSLRFFIPAVAFGAIGVAPYLRNVAIPFAVMAFALTIFDVFRFIGIFAADANTHGWFLVVIAAALGTLIPYRAWRRTTVTLLLLGFTAYAGRLAGSHAAGYYDDELTRGGRSSPVFSWLARERPAAVVGRTAPVGPIGIVSPTTTMIDGVDEGACVLAKRTGALLMVANTVDTGDAAFARERADARACGIALFDEPNAIVVRPR
jgi:hypothetical protein